MPHVKYIIYKNILELINIQKLELVKFKELTEKEVTSVPYIIIYTKNPNRNNDNKDIFKIFIYIITDNPEFYKSPNMLKVYKNIPEIKNFKKTFILDCYTIGNPQYSNFTSNVFPSVSIEDYLKHRFFSMYIFYTKALEYSLLKNKYMIFKDKKDIDELFTKLNFSKYDDQWVNKIGKILYNDPLSIWLGLEIGDIIHFDGYYRECVDIK